jgi:hypothetical protein
MNKKGFSITQLLPLAMVFVVLGIALPIAATVTDDVRDEQTAGSIAENISNHSLDALNTFGKWTPTLALVVVAAVIIGVVTTYLARSY